MTKREEEIDCALCFKKVSLSLLQSFFRFYATLTLLFPSFLLLFFFHSRLTFPSFPWKQAKRFCESKMFPWKRESHQKTRKESGLPRQSLRYFLAMTKKDRFPHSKLMSFLRKTIARAGMTETCKPKKLFCFLISLFCKETKQMEAK
jgi:hypothetical protein